MLQSSSSFYPLKSLMYWDAANVSPEPRWQAVFTPFPKLPTLSVPPQTLASAVVQVFTADRSFNWSKRCCGVACLVKDNPMRSYFIRVFDLKVRREQNIWCLISSRICTMSVFSAFDWSPWFLSFHRMVKSCLNRSSTTTSPPTSPNLISSHLLEMWVPLFILFHLHVPFSPSFTLLKRRALKMERQNFISHSIQMPPSVFTAGSFSVNILLVIINRAYIFTKCSWFFCRYSINVLEDQLDQICRSCRR